MIDTCMDYSAPDNSINLVEGYTQLPIFHPPLPRYATYSSVGALVAHEMMHGFDSGTGRYFNEDTVQAEPWDAATSATYEARTRCFVDQYNTYTYSAPGPASGRWPRTCRTPAGCVSPTTRGGATRLTTRTRTCRTCRTSTPSRTSSSSLCFTQTRGAGSSRQPPTSRG